MNNQEKQLNIYQKLSLLRSELTAVGRNAKGYGYNYVTLDRLLEVVNPLLEKQKLILINELSDDFLCVKLQNLENVKEEIKCRTQLRSGKLVSNFFLLDGISLENKIKFFKKINMTQEVGAEITYYTRYLTMLVLGLCATDDTDGVVVEKKSTAYEKKQSFQKAAAKPDKNKKPSLIEQGKMLNVFSEVGISKSDLEKITKIKNISKPESISAENFTKLRKIYIQVKSGNTNREKLLGDTNNV